MPIFFTMFFSRNTLVASESVVLTSRKLDANFSIYLLLYANYLLYCTLSYYVIL